MPRIPGQTLYLLALAVACSALVGYVFLFPAGESELQAHPRPIQRLDQIPFDGVRTHAFLSELCELGSRVSGSAGMARQQELLTRHFEKMGAKVTRQEFSVRHPLDGSAVNMANLIVTWHPERALRYLLCAHYDTRPFPDRDATNPRGKFVGANDGASGVAVLMELGRHMADLKGARGVDFVLFDGEELVFPEDIGEYFHGSTHFARGYVAQPPRHKYEGGVLLDMVGGADAKFYLEQYSMRYAPRLAGDLWAKAAQLGVRDFIRQQKWEVRDDHLPLNEIGRIRTIDVIGFDYPFWHTTQDVPANCSALTLAKVGWVVHEWLKSAVR